MAVTKVFNITLDVSAVLTNEEFRVKQGDNGNVFIISLVDDGVPVDLTGCRVVAMFTAGDRLAMQDNWTDDGGVTIGGEDNNVLTIELFNGSFVPGLNECEIQVYSGDALDTLITSASFNFRCARALINEDTILAMREYTLLTSLITSVQNVIKGAQSDWAETDTASQKYIDNKPTHMTPSAHASTHAADGVDPVPVSSHAPTHVSGGTDALNPADIGAAVVCAVQLTLIAAAWAGDSAPYTQQVIVNRVSSDCHVIPAPAINYEEVYSDCGIKVSEQGNRTLTFSCEDKPDNSVDVNVLIINGNETAYQGITTDTDDVEVTNSEILGLWNS